MPLKLLTLKQHHYTATINWTGNTGLGTKKYNSYSRDHSILINGKYQEIQASSDPSFRGDATKYNPEDLFLSSISGCHMLWYLHLCSQNDIVVLKYTDNAKGTMEVGVTGKGKFTSVTLQPNVVITDTNNIELANQLHHQANELCFIANSCNFKIAHNANCTARD